MIVVMLVVAANSATLGSRMASPQETIEQMKARIEAEVKVTLEAEIKAKLEDEMPKQLSLSSEQPRHQVEETSKAPPPPSPVLPPASSQVDKFTTQPPQPSPPSPAPVAHMETVTTKNTKTTKIPEKVEEKVVVVEKVSDEKPTETKHQEVKGSLNEEPEAKEEFQQPKIGAFKVDVVETALPKQPRQLKEDQASPNPKQGGKQDDNHNQDGNQDASHGSRQGGSRAERRAAARRARQAGKAQTQKKTGFHSWRFLLLLPAIPTALLLLHMLHMGTMQVQVQMKEPYRTLRRAASMQKYHLA